MHSSDGILLSCSPASHVFISVGNGSHIPVTSRGRSILTTPASNFALNNVLIVPSIIRNLLSVRQFTRDNSCSIEFDALGFSVKDLRTKRVILRCNSAGDLYTISASTPSTAQALLAASSSLWHQRLGHPGPAAIASLRHSCSIACNKSDRTICHTCQLGKHAHLPFPTSTSHTVLFPLWRLFIAMFGRLRFLAYQATLIIWLCWMIFLTFAGSLLSRKSDVHGHMVAFTAYARTQFGLPVKCFQAENGTEFVNKSTITHMAAHGILFRLSCPYTSP
jgi:hypothetical protein